MIRNLPERYKTENSLEIDQTVLETTAVIEKCRQLLADSPDYQPQDNYRYTNGSQFHTQKIFSTAHGEKKENDLKVIHLKPKKKKSPIQ